MEYIADVDYRHSKRIYKEFSNKNMSDYHDLYIQSNALLFADNLKTPEINVLKYMNSILLIFYLYLDWHGKHI